FARTNRREAAVHGLETRAWGYRRNARCERNGWEIVGVSAVRESTHRHVVGVYGHDGDLATAVAEFLADALDDGGTAIVIATPVHRMAIEAALSTAGASIDALAQSG